MRKFLSSLIVVVALGSATISTTEQIEHSSTQPYIQTDIVNVNPSAIFQKMTNGAGDS